MPGIRRFRLGATWRRESVPVSTGGRIDRSNLNLPPLATIVLRLEP